MVKIILDTPAKLLQFVRPISALPYEEIWVLLLNPDYHLVTGRSSTQRMAHRVTFNPHGVAQLLLQWRHRADRLILTHNHPDGNPAPSPLDINGTIQTQLLARSLGYQLVDHVIVTASGRHASLKQMEFI